MFSKHPWMTFFYFIFVSTSTSSNGTAASNFSHFLTRFSLFFFVFTKLDDLLILNGKTFFFMRQSDLSRCLLLTLWPRLQMTKHFNIIFDKFDKRLFIVCDVSESEWERMSKNTWWILFLFMEKCAMIVCRWFVCGTSSNRSIKSNFYHPRNWL